MVQPRRPLACLTHPASFAGTGSSDSEYELLSSRAGLSGAGSGEPSGVRDAGADRKTDVCVHGGNGNEAHRILRAPGAKLEAPRPPDDVEGTVH